MLSAVSIGSVTLDLFFKDSSLTMRKGRFTLACGGKYVVGQFHEGIGGGGSNVAIGLSRAGIKTALISQIGDGGLSLYIEDRLKHENIDCSLLYKKKDFSNISVILLSQKGERSIISHKAGYINLVFDKRHEQKIEYSDLFFVGNVPEISIEQRVHFLSLAQSANAVTAVNLGVKDCRKRLKALIPILRKTDIFIVNRYELADILSVEPAELLLPEINYHSKLNLSSSSILIVTDGIFGSWAHTSNRIYHQKAISTAEVIDTTGAGDAFTSGALSALLHKRNLETALLWGAYNSASAISFVTAQKGLLTFDKLNNTEQ